MSVIIAEAGGNVNRFFQKIWQIVRSRRGGRPPIDAARRGCYTDAIRRPEAGRRKERRVYA